MTKLNRIKRIETCLLALLLIVVLIAPAGVDAASRNKKKKKKKPSKPVVCVVDNNVNSANSMIKHLKKSGFIALMEYSDAIDVSKYDGLVIPGGNNIDPSVYGAELDPHTYKFDAAKDRIQIKAIQDFANARKPVLGICRGCQVVNVAFGGTINQHIEGWHKDYRRVRIQKGTWLYPYYGKRPKVYHWHHQCVDRLGNGLIATEWDEADGTIEAIQHVSLPVYGVQWHPDGMGRKGKKVFKAFNKVCKKYRKKNARRR